jgi:ribosomal protein S18 acetylase RimI-like enzyme
LHHRSGLVPAPLGADQAGLRPWHNRPIVRIDDAIRVDRATLRRLAEHEARLQAGAGRELRDLGDAILLLDPQDPEPYWNRLVAPEWPAERGAFDRRLDMAITLFASHGRLAHIWPLPSDNQPPDLAERLQAAGFESVGSDVLMVLADPGPAAARLGAPLPPGFTIERVEGLGAGSVRAAAAVADVLADAFDVSQNRRGAIELETLAGLEGPALHVTLVRVDGWPAAVAKRSTLAGSSYLSSIGTRPEVRRRGLGSLVTAVAIREAVEAGSQLTYLKVDAGNEEAQRLYRRLGFMPVAGRIPDLLLRR